MNMEQEQLFYEDEHEAFQAALTRSPKTTKQVAMELWPSMKPDSAYAKLKACLNGDKPDKFSFAEVIHFMQICGRYDPLYYLADETGHGRPERRAAEDEQAVLLRDIHRQQEILQRTFDRLQKTQNRIKAA